MRDYTGLRPTGTLQGTLKPASSDSATAKDLFIIRLVCSRPAFNSGAPAGMMFTQNTCPRLWRFLACRSRFPGRLNELIVRYLIALLAACTVALNSIIHPQASQKVKI